MAEPVVVCFPVIEEKTIQLNHLKTYFTNSGIVFADDDITEDIGKSLQSIVGKIGNWFETVNENDFDLVVNALFYLIATNYEINDNFDESLVENIVSNLINSSNFQYIQNYRLPIFQNWYNSYKSQPFNVLFLSPYLFLLEKMNYPSEYLPEIADIKLAFGSLEKRSKKFIDNLFHRLFSYLNHLYTVDKLSIQSSDFFHVCLDTLLRELNTKQLEMSKELHASLLSLFLNHNVLVSLSVADTERYCRLEDGLSDRILCVIFELLHSIKTNDSLASFCTDNSKIIEDLGFTVSQIEKASKYLIISKSAYFCPNLSYENISQLLGFSSEIELENFLYEANEKDVVKCCVDSKDRTVVFKWSSFIDDVKNAKEEVDDHLKKLSTQLLKIKENLC